MGTSGPSSNRRGREKPARAVSVLTWIYAAAFGFPAVPVALYLRSRGALPTFMDLFPMYGGPWSSSMRSTSLISALIAFLVITLIAAWSGWLLWQGSRLGAIVNVALLPLEAVFWIGFALPIPWLVGSGRVLLVARAWRSLD